MTEQWAFTDLHCHVIPALDDGPATLEEAVDLVCVAFQTGTMTLVATSHSAEVLEARLSLQHLQERLDAVRLASQARGCSPRLLLGSEVFLEPRSVDDLEHGRLFTINGSHYVLVEAPMEMLPLYFDDILFQLAARGYVPIIAHPERNARVQREHELLGHWAARGYLLQITAGSLLGSFGRQEERTAFLAIERGWCQIVSSDGHNSGARTPRLDLAAQFLSEHFGEATALALLHTNPLAVIEDRVLESAITLPPVRKASSSPWQYLRRWRSVDHHR